VNWITTAHGLTPLAQVPGAGAADTSVIADQAQTIWSLAVKGGPVMIPIGLCSLVALAVIVERLLSLRRSIVTPADFHTKLKASLEPGNGNCKAALEYCHENGSPIANIFTAGIKRLGEPIERLEKHIQEAGQREVFKLRKYLRLLALIASISPLLGLLGTIFGMIKAFQTVAMAGEALGKAELLATGIYEAMITTAAGLLVAIPTLIGYHWISARIEHLVAEMDQMTCEFVEEYAGSTGAPDDAESRIRPVSEPMSLDRETSSEPEAALSSA
jgi:biopolymer transport protein ExbB